MTRLPAINSIEGGGIKMIDIDSMVKAVRIALLKPIFNDNESTWKSNLLYLLKDVGGSIFYSELLQWWSEFRDHLFDEKY